MKKLLQINTGIHGEGSNSTAMAVQFAEKWASKGQDREILVRDLVSNPVNHLDSTTVGAFYTPESDRSSVQQQAVELSDELVAEITQADAVVIGLPLYNFGVPSVLKAYFDQLARVGVTFEYTANGPKGKLADKPVYLMCARGGKYANTEFDHQIPFVKQFLNFIGLQNVEAIYAEGLAMGDEVKATEMEAANEAMAKLVG